MSSNEEYLPNLTQFLLENEIPFEFGYTSEGDGVCVRVRDTEDERCQVAFVGPLDVRIEDGRPGKVRALAALYESYNTWRWKDLEEDDPRVVTHRRAIEAVEALFALAEKERDR